MFILVQNNWRIYSIAVLHTHLVGTSEDMFERSTREVQSSISANDSSPAEHFVTVRHVLSAISRFSPEFCREAYFDILRAAITHSGLRASVSVNNQWNNLTHFVVYVMMRRNLYVRARQEMWRLERHTNKIHCSNETTGRDGDTWHLSFLCWKRDERALVAECHRRLTRELDFRHFSVEIAVVRL